jgi:hypothetical protein
MPTTARPHLFASSLAARRRKPGCGPAASRLCQRMVYDVLFSVKCQSKTRKFGADSEKDVEEPLQVVDGAMGLVANE